MLHRMSMAAPDWYLVSLRPRGQHEPMRSAAARHGGGVVAISPWALRRRDDEHVEATLSMALGAPRVVFTSPAAVRAAAALLPLRPTEHHQWFAVGSGTAAALADAGAREVAMPERMDSEGLLALPGLQDIARTRIGLVTAPGGRGTLVPAFEARGATVVRADVYHRQPLSPSPRAMTALRELQRPAVLAVSSGEGLQQVLLNLPPDLASRLRALPVVAASDRLVELAERLGFDRASRARSARPADLADAAAAALR